VKTIKGDVLKPKDVEAAFLKEEYTDVIVSLGSKDLKKAMIRSAGTKNIIQALSENKIKPVIHVVSALGIGDSWSQLNWLGKLFCKVLLKSTMEDHTEQESSVLNSQFPHHIIRPVGLKDGEATGEIHVQNEGFLPLNTIQRADVANYLVNSLLENKQGVSGICQKK